MMVKASAASPMGVAEVFLIMPECHKTFAVKKGLCEAAMCGWAGGIHLHSCGGGLVRGEYVSAVRIGLAD